MFFGLYFLAVERARRRYGAARLTFLMSVLAAGMLALAAAAATLGLHQALLPGGWRGWAVLAALGLVSHAGGQGLLAVAMGSLPAMFSSLVIFLEAVAAAGIAALVLGEPVTPAQAVGGLMILLGIWVARPRRA